MKYEVLFSDTAREDFDVLDCDSPERARVQSLLDRIAAGDEGGDHVLSAPESRFELRYLSLETTFVLFRRDPVKGQATVVCFRGMDVQPAAAPLATPAWRMIDTQTREIPHGMEIESAVEFTEADGSRNLVRHFARKIDMGDTYVVFQHVAKGTSPATTMIVTGKKGQIHGDFRHDEVELITLQPDGTVHRFPPNSAHICIRSPFEGLTESQMQERMAEWMRTPEQQARFEAARKWFRLG